LPAGQATAERYFQVKISYNWLKEYIDIDIPPSALADILTMAGLEVESVAEVGKDIKGVVVAQILSMEKHPNADRLSFCRVKTDRGVHEVVCGASNMQAGDYVALALPGAAFPGNIKIGKTKIRGVVSEGMMCSEVELGLKDTSDGIMILEKGLTLGDDITSALGIMDAVLEINVTPNRPDCLSISGIAKEVAAAIGKELKERSVNLNETGSDVNGIIKVSIKEPAQCHRYTARVIEGVAVKESPDWLKRRLTALGVRPINNIVDVTNYVMFEYGQPLHAFDYDKISDKRIVVRKSKKGEGITTLDGIKRKLDEGVLVICDSKKPVAVAGITGGEDTAVSLSTKNILLESAYFLPASIRRTSKALGLSSESSYRFERGVDKNGAANALDRAAELINIFAGGKTAKGFIDNYPDRYEPVSVAFRWERVNRMLGTDLNKEDIETYLTRLGFSFVRSLKVNDSVMVFPPSFRVDITKEIDLIEDVARLYGYDKIPTTLPKARLVTVTRKKKDIVISKVRGFLASMGFCESINYSFISPQILNISMMDQLSPIRLSNPLSEDESIMRGSLMPGLLSVLKYNLNHNNKGIRIFETGPVFRQDGNSYREDAFVSGLISGLRVSEDSLVWDNTEADFFDIKGVVEGMMMAAGVRSPLFNAKRDIAYLNPGKACSISACGVDIGVMGEVHPSAADKLNLKQPAYVFELNIDSIVRAEAGRFVFKKIPGYPSVIRDSALIIDRNIPFSDLVNAVYSMCIKLVEDIKVFDVYYAANIPEGKKSVALRLIYRSLDRTLTDEEVSALHNNVVANILKKFGGEVRGV